MKRHILIILTFIFAFSIAIRAQEQNAKQSANKKTAIFKIPDGFMPAKMPPGKNGLTMLNPNKPAGIFVVYTPDNQKSDDFVLDMRKMYAGYFSHDESAEMDWKETVLPAHEGVKDEIGKMFTTTNSDKELQVVAYIRTISENQDVIYGYFAMRDSKSKKNSADFIDEQGKGVKEFDKFWKTVGVEK